LPDISSSPNFYYLLGAGATIWITQQVSGLALGIYRTVQAKRNGHSGKPQCGCPYADDHTQALTKMSKGIESMGRVLSATPAIIERQRESFTTLKVMCSNMEKQGIVLEELAKQQAVLLDRAMRK